MNLSWHLHGTILYWKNFSCVHYYIEHDIKLKLFSRNFNRGATHDTSSISCLRIKLCDGYAGLKNLTKTFFFFICSKEVFPCLVQFCCGRQLSCCNVSVDRGTLFYPQTDLRTFLNKVNYHCLRSEGKDVLRTFISEFQTRISDVTSSRIEPRTPCFTRWQAKPYIQRPST